jgi:hypothetical protein
MNTDAIITSPFLPAYDFSNQSIFLALAIRRLEARRSLLYSRSSESIFNVAAMKMVCALLSHASNGTPSRSISELREQRFWCFFRIIFCENERFSQNKNARFQMLNHL